MNQILLTNDYSYLEGKNILEPKRKKFLIIFYLSIIICILVLIYLLYSYFSITNEKKQTSIIKDKYQITSLYSSSNNYTAIKLSDNISIIGLIEIPSINISYPVLSESSEESLKISVCKFSGPLPNRIGNLCIAGHNYKNSLMFSKLNDLNINDSIFITDLNNVRLEYSVFEKYIVKENNLNCTNTTTNIELTLITCNDYNNKERIVIKAKVKD